MRNLLKISFNPNRIFGLDILRTMAIMFVLLGHSSTFLPREIAYFSNKLLYDGVGIFFVLSGFLIGGILIKLLENYKINKNLLLFFWEKRWYRTLPNYYLILIILVFCDFLFKENFSFIPYIKYFFFCQNLITSSSNFFEESWSLAIEEWFYLITPIIISFFIIILKKKTRTAILSSVILIIVFFTLYRFLYFIKLESINYEVLKNIRYSVFGRSDSLMYGILGAYIFYYKNNFWNKYKNIFLCIGICLSTIYYAIPINTDYFSMVFSFTITSLSILFMLPFFNNIKRGKGIFYKIITYTSLISYSLYLVNSQISKILRKFVDYKADDIIDFYHSNISANYAWTVLFIFCFSLFWFLTFFISILLYKYFETPFMKLRDKKVNFNLTKKHP